MSNALFVLCLTFCAHSVSDVLAYGYVLLSIALHTLAGSPLSTLPRTLSLIACWCCSFINLIVASMCLLGILP
jgi:hypothetical protein